MRSRAWLGVIGTTLIACGTLLSTATPAGARPSNVPLPATAFSFPTGSVPSEASPLGAGYFSQPADGMVSASTSFVMPSVTCASGSDNEALFLGVNAYSDSLPGVREYAVGQAQCVNGTAAYYIVAKTPGGPFNFASTSPGHKLVASLSETSTLTTATIRDVTSHTGMTSTDAPATDSAVLVGERGYAVVPSFTSVVMQSCRVNGLLLADAEPLTRETLKSSIAVQTSASVITADSDHFKLTFKNNA